MDIFELLDKKFDLNEQIFRLNNLMFGQYDVFVKQSRMCTFATAFEHELLCRWKYSYGRDKIVELLEDLNLRCIQFSTMPKSEKEAFGCLQLSYNIPL